MVKVRVVASGRVLIQGKIYMRKNGEFELLDSVASPLIKRGIIATVVQPLLPSISDEEVSSLKKRVSELEALVKKKESQIISFTAELNAKTQEIQKKDSDLAALNSKKK